VFGPIGQEVYERTYSRPKPDGTSETWDDTVARVVRGNSELAPADPAELVELEKLMRDFKVIPAGRHLWASGADTQLGLFNCHRAGWTADPADHFCFTFDQLMLGGGVGANYSSEYLRDLPDLHKVEVNFADHSSHPDAAMLPPRSWACAGELVIIEDSREGWVDALRLLLDASAAGIPALTFDANDVRPAGAPIIGFGGTASGPGPLLDMLKQVADLISGLENGRLDPMTAMSIDHAIASCVIAGNVRRSARMSILHWNDPQIEEFLRCKADHESHWTTNISVEVDRDFFIGLERRETHARHVLGLIAHGMYTNGEPGVFNSSLASMNERDEVRSTNPCGEIALNEWEQCCLGHVNLAAFADDHEGALEAFRLMARFLVRATFGKASDPRQEAIKNQNRRIGVGFFGFADWLALNGLRYDEFPGDLEMTERLKAYKRTVQKAAQEYAEELGIPAPIKSTTVAPTGSIAKLPGVSEGIQPPFARFFIRRVRYSETDPKLAELAHLDMEPCQYSRGTTVVSFPCMDPIMQKVAPELVAQSDEIGIETYMRVQARVQHHFADNAVSITANFDRSLTTELELADLLERWLPELKGFTAMPEDGRPQSPYERMTEDQFLEYGEVAVSQAMDDCAGGACPIR